MSSSVKIVFWGQGEDWLPYMLGDVNKIDNASVVNDDFPLQYSSSIVKRVIRHFVLSPKVPYAFQKRWFRRISEAVFSGDDDSPKIVAFFDWNKLGASKHYLHYLRENFKGIRLVYIFTNIVRISGAKCKYGILNELNSLFDQVYTFEEDDSKEYGFSLSPLFNAGFISNNIANTINRVFFVGLAKDRYSKLIQLYDRLAQIGIDSLFYINRVSSSEQVNKPGLIYNVRIPYRRTLELEQSSTCLLDIVQGGAKGYTLKVRSAIANDKLLITNNPYIKQAPFYNPNYILYFETPEDIVPSFFDNPNRVSYTQAEKDYFSLAVFVEQMKKDLNIYQVV